MRRFSGSFELGLKFAAIAAVLVGIRAVLWALGVEKKAAATLTPDE